MSFIFPRVNPVSYHLVDSVWILISWWNILLAASDRHRTFCKNIDYQQNDDTSNLHHLTIAARQWDSIYVGCKNAVDNCSKKKEEKCSIATRTKHHSVIKIITGACSVHNRHNQWPSYYSEIHHNTKASRNSSKLCSINLTQLNHNEIHNAAQWKHFVTWHFFFMLSEAFKNNLRNKIDGTRGDAKRMKNTQK